MKLVDYDEDNHSLFDKVFWWKTYIDHIIDEIHRLRGRSIAGLKKICTEGVLSTNYFLYLM